MEKLLFICFSILMYFTINGCVASSSYYTARTLEKNKLALGFSADDILIKSSNSSGIQVGISKDLPFAPSIGFAYGLPLRLETGLRWYPPKFIEATLREQVNPRTFDEFDFSINFSFATLLGAYSYVKYGATISKKIDMLEPFLHYSFYHTVGDLKMSGDNSFDGFINDLTSNLINNSRTIGFGLGIQVKKVEFFPEADYQYFDNNMSYGLWHLGIGLHLYTN